jgi:hypothetical protein
MALFTKKPLDLSAKRAALVARLHTAETRLAELRQQAVTAARNGTPLDAAAAWQAQFDLDALQAALAEIDRERAAQEAQAIQEADEAQRKQTAQALHAAAAEFEQAFAPFAEVMRQGHAAYAKFEHLLGSSGLPTLLQNLAVEIPAAIAIHAAELRARAARVREGTAPPSLPAPPQLEIVKVEPVAPTISIFSLQSLQWRDAAGRLEVCGPFQIHALPVKAAKTALARNLALEPASPRAQAIIHGKDGQPHLLDPGKTYDLDADPNEKKQTGPGGPGPLRPAPQIQVIDRGPPRTAHFAKGPEPKPGGPNDDVL